MNSERMKNTLRMNRVKFVSTTTDIESLVRAMPPNVVTMCTAENILANPTTSGKASALYSHMARRPEHDMVKLVRALIETGNGHLAEILSPGAASVPAQPEVAKLNSHVNSGTEVKNTPSKMACANIGDWKAVLCKNTIDIVNGTSDWKQVAMTLFQHGVINTHMKQRALSFNTEYEVGYYILDNMARRPDGDFEKFLMALEQTGNKHVAQKLQPDRPDYNEQLDTSPFACPVKKTMFRELIKAVKELEPVVVNNERRTRQTEYKVAVDFYTESLPKSEVDPKALPFAMALYMDYPRGKVMAWPNCPAKMELENAEREYRDEMESATELLNVLIECSVELQSRKHPSMDWALNFLKTLSQGKADLYMEWSRIDKSLWSPANFKTVALQLHLIMCCNYLSIAVRKDIDNKPSSYLLYNAIELSSVVLDKHRHIVKEEISKNESNVAPNDVQFQAELRPF